MEHTYVGGGATEAGMYSILNQQKCAQCGEDKSAALQGLQQAARTLYLQWRSKLQQHGGGARILRQMYR